MNSFIQEGLLEGLLSFIGKEKLCCFCQSCSWRKTGKIFDLKISRICYLFLGIYEWQKAAILSCQGLGIWIKTVVLNDDWAFKQAEEILGLSWPNESGSPG